MEQPSARQQQRFWNLITHRRLSLNGIVKSCGGMWLFILPKSFSLTSPLYANLSRFSLRPVFVRHLSSWKPACRYRAPWSWWGRSWWRTRRNTTRRTGAPRRNCPSRSPTRTAIPPACASPRLPAQVRHSGPIHQAGMMHFTHKSHLFATQTPNRCIAHHFHRPLHQLRVLLAVALHTSCQAHTLRLTRVS